MFLTFFVTCQGNVDWSAVAWQRDGCFPGGYGWMDGRNLRIQQATGFNHQATPNSRTKSAWVDLLEPTLRILTPFMETPDPPNDTPGALKQVVLTPHDTPWSLREWWMLDDWWLTDDGWFMMGMMLLSYTCCPSSIIAPVIDHRTSDW